jgi:hypothetical protein
MRCGEIRSASAVARAAAAATATAAVAIASAATAPATTSATTTVFAALRAAAVTALAAALRTLLSTAAARAEIAALAAALSASAATTAARSAILGSLTARFIRARLLRRSLGGLAAENRFHPAEQARAFFQRGFALFLFATRALGIVGVAAIARRAKLLHAARFTFRLRVLEPQGPRALALGRLVRFVFVVFRSDDLLVFTFIGRRRALAFGTRLVAARRRRCGGGLDILRRGHFAGLRGGGRARGGRRFFVNAFFGVRSVRPAITIPIPAAVTITVEASIVFASTTATASTIATASAAFVVAAAP